MPKTCMGQIVERFVDHETINLDIINVTKKEKKYVWLVGLAAMMVALIARKVMICIVKLN